MFNVNSQTVTFAAQAASKARSKTRFKNGFKIIIAVLLTVGSWQVGSSVYLLAKAQFAQYLIAGAWDQTMQDGKPHKPWDWADTYPVAKLSFPELAQTSYVLQGASGRNMAFGPARTLTGGMPGDELSTVISAHNDSHFKFLSEVKLKDLIHIETSNGLFTYQISDLRVVDSLQRKVTIRQQDELILTTCYPFNALQTGGNLRFQVTAIRILHNA